MVKYLCLFFLGMASWSFGQSAPVQVEQAPYGLGEEALSDAQIQGFQNLGRQKLTDFQELGQLLADPEQPAPFKEQALKMLAALAEAETTELIVYDRVKAAFVTMPLGDYGPALSNATAQIEPIQFIIQEVATDARQTGEVLRWSVLVGLKEPDADTTTFCRIQMKAVRAFQQAGGYGRISWQTVIEGMELVP